jgi:SAM-dependent methyltransferase
VRGELCQALRFSQRVLRRFVVLLSSAEQRLRHARAVSSTQRAEVIRSTRYCMTAGINEAYYREQYLSWIRSSLESFSSNAPSGRCFDLGCGQGRLLLPLMDELHDWEFTGVDLSQSALDLIPASSGRLTLICSDLREFLQSQADRSVDLALMTEVTFFYPEWGAAVDELARVLRPGGLAFISFRSRYFYGLMLALNRGLDEVERLLARSDGDLRIFGTSDLTMTWQSSSEIRSRFGPESGWILHDLVAIGACSGIVGDPHGEIVRPEFLSQREMGLLNDLEVGLAREVPDGGRYMLAVLSRR